MAVLLSPRAGFGYASLLAFCAEQQEPAHFHPERRDALNFHEDKAATKAEHELFPCNGSGGLQAAAVAWI